MSTRKVRRVKKGGRRNVSVFSVLRTLYSLVSTRPARRRRGRRSSAKAGRRSSKAGRRRSNKH